MFLSKRSNGIYYIYYQNTDGKRNRISTKTTIKSEALKFLSNFSKELETRREKKLTQISLNDWCIRFLSLSKSIHTEKTYKAYKLSLDHLQNSIGSIRLIDISHKLLAHYFEKRIEISSIYQARKDRFVLIVVLIMQLQRIISYKIHVEI